MIRRRNKRQCMTSLDEVSDDARGLQQCLVDERRTPEEACRDEEVNELLAQQIQQLPLPTRTAFLLRDVDELTTSESMERLGVNESALKSRVLRARRRIAQNMGQLLHADRQRNRFSITDD
jgi:RNA polymerase sigma-70 factor (ECF subfamily)